MSTLSRNKTYLPKPDLSFFKPFISYLPDNGHFIWLVDRNWRSKAGDRAGQLNPDGYRRIKIQGRCFWASHLAWLFTNGVWPADEIDHIDRDRDNNAILNLRESSRSDNMGNMKKKDRGLPKGVHLAKNGRFIAQGSKYGKKYYLGRHDTPEQASQAYKIWAEDNHKEFALS